jgi:guanylate kinase
MKDFEDLIKENGFLEHAKFGDNRYGTSKRMIEDMGRKGKVVILDIEMEVSLRGIELAIGRGDGEKGIWTGLIVV